MICAAVTRLTRKVQMKIPRMLATILGCLMMLLGLAAVVVPDRVLPFARFTTTPSGVYVAAGIRLLIGLILLMAAGASRFPKVLRVLGALVVLGGIATVLVGTAGAQAISARLFNYGATIIRGIGVFVLAVGSFVVYAVTVRKQQA
jgi:hypothetical protein